MRLHVQQYIGWSTFLHMLVHFLGNVSSIVLYTGGLPDYREAWYMQ